MKTYKYSVTFTATSYRQNLRFVWSFLVLAAYMLFTGHCYISFPSFQESVKGEEVP